MSAPRLRFEVIEVEMVGKRVAFVLPAVTEDMPTGLKNALGRRRSAVITGRCDCGATFGPLNDDDDIPHLSMAHEHDCSASDEALGELLRRHGVKAR